MTNETQSPAESPKTNARNVGAAVAMSIAMLLGSAGIAAAQTEPAQTEPVQDDSADEEQRDRSDRRQRRSERRARIGSLIADTIGITLVELRSEVRQGNSVADVAEDNGVASSTVVDALISALEERLDSAVENGRLTEEEAADRFERRSERIAERVERVPGERRANADG